MYLARLLQLLQHSTWALHALSHHALPLYRLSAELITNQAMPLYSQSIQNQSPGAAPLQTVRNESE